LAVVEYDDTDGDSVRFYFDEAKGTLNYEVNGVPKVLAIAELALTPRSGGDVGVHLVGTAAGLWSPRRCTVVPARTEDATKKIELLFNRAAQESSK